MSKLPGTWALTMRTPIGSIEAEMIFMIIDGDELIQGTATGKAETVPLRDIQAAKTEHGERITWKQTITKPLRLNLDFDVFIKDDVMEGYSRAGKLPRTLVSGPVSTKP